MSSQPRTLTTKATLTTEQKVIVLSEQLAKYIIYAGLGALGGATGVALVIGLSIIVVLLAPPPITLSSGMLPLALIAIIVGLGIAWLFYQAAIRTRPNLFPKTDRQLLSIMLICSLITSLVQSLLFGSGL